MTVPWKERDRRVRQQADDCGTEPSKYRSDLIRTVKRLIALKRCVASAEAWITVSRRLDNQRRYRIVLSGNADGQAGTYPAIRLNGLRELNDGALLTVSAVVAKDGGVVEYTAGLSGILKIK